MKPETKRLEVAPSVATYAARHSITVDRLIEMVDAAALHSKGRCNRRFKDWLFEVRNGVVIFITPFTDYRQVPRPGPGEFMAYEECDKCDGLGCYSCDDTGEVAVIRREPSNRNSW